MGIRFSKIRRWFNWRSPDSSEKLEHERLLTLARANVAREYGTDHCGCSDVMPCVCSMVSIEYSRLKSFRKSSI
jgi:hypothetical protein